eukprot:TRINITY_DN4313_c0_g1_i4.p1 TRINITY_DN4313_c0_g1~~TRINITY_DN4313_c0_g1_i4.p1  ORF type:complete len:238 (+),score=13.56 TRINITY_DN4313_c0_g1_i4:99-812(+)
MGKSNFSLNMFSKLKYTAPKQASFRRFEKPTLVPSMERRTFSSVVELLAKISIDPKASEKYTKKRDIKGSKGNELKRYYKHFDNADKDQKLMIEKSLPCQEIFVKRIENKDEGSELFQYLDRRADLKRVCIEAPFRSTCNLEAFLLRLRHILQDIELSITSSTSCNKKLLTILNIASLRRLTLKNTFFHSPRGYLNLFNSSKTLRVLELHFNCPCIGHLIESISELQVLTDLTLIFM